jgi:cysteine desulfurase
MNSRIYLDNNATTPVAPEVVEAMLPFYQIHFGNPSSIHWFGQQAKAALDQARQRVANCLGAESNEIVFCSGGTEADNMALLGVVNSSRQSQKHIITSKIEHHAILHPCKFLEKQGVRITYVGVDSQGRVDPAEIEAAITPETLLISIMYANNESGTIQPIQKIAQIARQHKIIFHSDAVQALGKIPVKVDDLGVDLLSFSGHKIHAPKGIGGLFVRKGTSLKPVLFGGGHERSRRPGTENIPCVVALGKACEMVADRQLENTAYLLRLRNSFEELLFQRISGVSLNGHPEYRLPNTSNLRFEDVEGEGVIINLDIAGVAASSGSACTSGSIEPSHVLSAMGLSRNEAFGAIRFSFSIYNKLEEITQTVEILSRILNRMRSLASSKIRTG